MVYFGPVDCSILNFNHNIMQSFRKAERRPDFNQQHMYKLHVLTSGPYIRAHVTSDSTLRKHAQPVANPKLYFSVINVQIRNSAQHAMQLLQSSYSVVMNRGHVTRSGIAGRGINVSKARVHPFCTKNILSTFPLIQSLI